MQITVHTADCCGNPQNIYYPFSKTVSNEKDFAALIAKDHMFSAMRGGQRSIANFLETSVLGTDEDNEHSDNPADWICPEDIPAIFQDVACVVYTSRNHMKQKGTKSARPRMHVAFPVPTITSPEDYSALMNRLQSYFPYVDGNAKDPARFFYANPEAEVHFYEGSRNLVDFLDEQEQLEAQEFADWDAEHPSAPWEQPIPEGSRNSTLHGIALRLLKRLGDTEEAHTGFQAAADRCSPPLPEGELSTIWASALKYYSKVISRQPGYIPPAQYGAPAETQWETPIPLSLPAPPEFPVEAFPEVLRDISCAVSECIQAPLALICCSVLALMAVCLQGKYKVRAKPGWTEPLNLFMDVTLGPSERKSAVLNRLEAPIIEFEKKFNLDHANAIEASASKRSVLEKRKRFLEDQLAKGKGSLAELDEVIKQSNELRVVKPLRLFSDNITMEKLCSVMSANDGRAAIMSTEPGILDIMDGAYSDTVNIDVMLKAYSGDPIRVERIGRAEERVDNPTLTVLLMSQPSALDSLMSNRKFKARGLTSRILYGMPLPMAGRRRYQTQDVPPKVDQAYKKLIQNLLTDEYPSEPTRVPVIVLSAGASAMHREFYEEMEHLQGTEFQNYPALQEWAGKLPGNVLRIAGLLSRVKADFHYPSIENPFDDFLFEEDDRDVFCRNSTSLEVDAETMASAVAIGRYFLECARPAFSIMGADQLSSDCRYVLSAICGRNLIEFSSREILRACRRFRTKDEILPVLQHLVDYGYLAPKDVVYTGKGRPQADVWLVNPLLFRESARADDLPAA